jgi:xeroderma pigmentosum group C-complementing protein
MSFHWNLSSDEEDENEEFESKLSEVNRAPAHVTPQSSKTATSNDSSVARMPTTTDAQDFFFSDDDGEDEVDWEDADSVGSDEFLDTKLPSNNNGQTPKPITIDMNAPTKANAKKNRKRSARRMYRFHSLPPHLQSLLLDIQRSHLLTLSSRAIQISKCCSNSEVLHVANSLVPTSQNSSNDQVPREVEVREFLSWYTTLVNQVTQRRIRIRAANEAAGAPPSRQSKKRKVSIGEHRLASIQPDRLLEVSSFLSPTNEEHHHLLIQDQMELSNQDKVQLLVATARSKGWRARYVTILDPVGLDLDVDHPLFAMKNIRNVFRAFSKTTRTVASLDTKPAATDKQIPTFSDREIGWVEILCKPSSPKGRKSTNQYRWVHVDPSRNLIDRPSDVESLYKTVIHGNEGCPKTTIAYVLAVEHLPRDLRDLIAGDGGEENQHQLRLTDVTKRYANSWSQSLRLRTAKKSRTDEIADNPWWAETIKAINQHHRSGLKSRDIVSTIGLSKLDAIEIQDSSDENGMDGSMHTDEVVEREEKEELSTSAANEAIPTSKAAFNNHPVYAIQAVLNSNEVFAPDAKDRICGIFKGSPVYRRSDVHTAITAEKWLYEGRRVKDDELKKPIKRVKARKKPTPKGFQALQSYGVGATNDGSEEARQRDIAKGSGLEEENDGMQNLYAIWQTLPWSPIPVGPNDAIPTNDYNNVELKLLNPGLVHIEEAGASRVAKMLGIPYAPCLLGFEGHGGNRTPSIRGIVVHEHNADLLREALTEFMSSQLEREHEKRVERIRKRWKKLIVGLLTKERLEREYGGD